MIKIGVLQKKYRKKYAIDIQDLYLDHNIVVGLIGKNGAGKSTLMKLISGKIRPTHSQEYFVLGEKPYNSTKVAKEVGYYHSDMQFADERILDVIESYEVIYEKFDKRKCIDLIKIFKIDINKKVKNLSQGMKAIFIVSLALSCGKKIILLDEPTAFMDKNARMLFKKMILLEKQKSDKMIVISTHLAEEMADVLDICVILNEGKLQCIENKYNDATMQKIVDINKVQQLEEVYENEK